MAYLYALLLTLLPLNPAPVDELSGTVEADDGSPLPGATVTIDALDRGTATNEEGRFAFAGIPEGTHTLEVRFIGYQPEERTVTVPQEEELRIVLSPDEGAIDDVIVTASPVGSTAYQPAEALGPRELQERSASSFGELLDGEPGIAMRSTGPAPSRPVIRGFDGDRVLILENGNRMGDISNTAADHNVSLDPMAAERVEVVRGPASLLYGSSAIGGVVNLLTSDIPREWSTGHSGRVALESASMNDAVSGFGRYQAGGEQWAGTARFSYRNAGDVRTPEGLLPGTAINNGESSAGVGYQGNGLSAGLSASFNDYRFGLPEEIDDPDEEAEIRMDQQTVQGFGSWATSGFIERVDLRFHAARLFQQEIKMATEPDGSIGEGVELEFLQHTGNATLALTHQPVGIFDTGSIGATFHAGTTDVGGEEAFTPGVAQRTGALFTFQEVPLTEAVRLQLGLRGEQQSQRTLTNDEFPDIDEQSTSRAVSGSLGLNVRPSSSLEIGLQIARAHRFPLLEERFADGIHFGLGVFERGDPSLGTEVGVGTDIFARWSTERLRAEVAGFYTRINDFVAFEPTGDTLVDDSDRTWDIFEYRAGDAEIFGGEAQLIVLLTHTLQVGGSLDLVRGTRIDTDEPLPTIPPIRGRLTARYEPEPWWVGASARFVDSQNRVARQEQPTAGYTLLGAHAGIQLGSNGMHRISVRVDNLTNTSYRDHLSRIDRTEFGAPMPGRDLSLSYRYTF